MIRKRKACKTCYYDIPRNAESVQTNCDRILIVQVSWKISLIKYVAFIAYSHGYTKILYDTD